MSRLWLVFLLTLLAMVNFSCQRNIFKSTSDEKTVALDIKKFQFDYLKAKAKFRYNDGKNDLKATANIRVRKDSVIWMSISATLGIEAARIMINSDSMTVMDRLNKTYSVYKYDDLSEKYNFQMDYSLLQAVLLGDMSHPILKEDKVSKEPSYFLVLQDRGNVRMENYIGFQTQKLERLKWLDIPTSNTLSINYTNFQWINDHIFPYENQILLKYSDASKRIKNTQINIGYNRAEVSDKKEKFPFNIPQKYDRK